MFEDPLSFLVRWSLVVKLTLLPYLGVALFLTFVYVVLSLPLRRRERARLFLDIVDMGTADGHSPERAILNAAASGDRMLGRHFHMLAEYLRRGAPLREALQSAPRVLPPEIIGMLNVGFELGDVRRVLPACRQVLADAVSQTRGALNYLAVLGFVLLPVLPGVMAVMNIFVMPKFIVISEDMRVPISAFAQAVFASRGLLLLTTAALMLVVQTLVVFYILGPRGRTLAVESPIGRMIDRLLWLLPWRRNRMKRDFAAMLALALDAGMPEERALRLAGASTANRTFMAGAQHAAEALSRGAKLTDALALLDHGAELQWRIAGARHSRSGFFNMLRGWMQMLDAKAFQQEQSAAQIATTALVIINGVIIGFFVVAVFSILISISTEAALW